MIEIIISEFITHVAKTDNKVADNKFIKINGQAIYNGALQRFSRAIVMNNMHSYISSYLEPYRGLLIDYPIKVTYEIHTVVNHGSIALRKGLISWKPPGVNYKPNFDLDNALGCWSKAGNDALVQNNVIIDDNTSIIRELSYKFIPVDNINDRKIIIKINKYSEV